MFGFAAAPEIVIAVPSDTPDRPPYPRGSASVPAIARYLTLGLPPCSAVSVKESACRSCHARSVPATRLIAVFTMGSGRLGEAGARARSSWNNAARPEGDDGPHAPLAPIPPPPP